MDQNKQVLKKKRKVVLISYPSVLKYVLCAQKNRLIEKALWVPTT